MGLGFYERDPMTAAAAPTRDIIAWIVLFFCGLSWGVTGPLSKLAVSTGHHPVAITFWSALIAAVVFSIVLIVRRERPAISRFAAFFFLGCGFLGTAFPNSISYEAYRHLPVGVNVMILSLVPMATLLIALPFGVEKLDIRRAMGLGLGVIAVTLITLPSTSLPSPEIAIYVALPVLVAVSYAAENIWIARLQPKGMSTVIVMWGLSVGGVVLLAPVTFGLDVLFDITVMGPPELAVIASSIVHIGAYFGFVWMINRSGPVFASQVGYIVTATGVLLGMAFYDERHSAWVWAALALMMIGLSLVKPADRRE